jgi:hypothetical protein
MQDINILEHHETEYARTFTAKCWSSFVIARSIHTHCSNCLIAHVVNTRIEPSRGLFRSDFSIIICCDYHEGGNWTCGIPQSSLQS